MNISSVSISANRDHIIVDIPQSAVFHGAVQYSNVTEVFYSFVDGDEPKKNVDLRIVAYMEGYDNDYIYIDKVIDPKSSKIMHVLFKELLQ